ncbi:hypothetical protein B9Z55_028008 [Caenorhabditis nigoni]|nr:hypothetical protein B9Z55_028008 [Caenorhabditis nigoni]
MMQTNFDIVKKIEKSFEASKKNVVVQIQLYATVQVEKVQVGGPSGVVDPEEVNDWSSELVLENYRKPTDVVRTLFFFIFPIKIVFLSNPPPPEPPCFNPFK